MPPNPAAPLHVTIDGREHAVAAGGSVLDALRGLGVALPTLCHDPRLAPVGDCWSCAVEVGMRSNDATAAPPQVLPACHTPLAAGMAIATASAALLAFRHGLLVQLATRASAAGFAAWPAKELHVALSAHGIAPLAPAGEAASIDASHPHLQVDMSRCIQCFRCVRICDQVQGESIWHAVGRGAELRIVPADAPTLGASACVGCGACADACPTAAIVDAARVGAAAPQRWTRTVCPYCGVGCELELGVADDRLVATRPAIDAAVNRGHACAKGRYALGYVDAPGRETRPLLRDGSGWRAVEWPQAIAAAAAGLRRVRERHGADAIGVLASSRATNEENFLTQKFARVALGTHNVDCCARVCHAPSAVAMQRMLGTGAATSSYDDIERAAAILVWGANALECHPVVGARIRQRARNGARLLVVDPRRTALAASAELHLAPRPGTDIALLNAIGHVLLREGLVDESFLAARVDGRDEYARHVAAWTPERAAATCGVSIEAIVAAARLYGGTRPALAFHGLGLTEQLQGTEGVMALVDLALLTGNLGRPGAGINPLRGQNNVQGAAIMGCEPASLTGGVAIAAARARHETHWGVALPTTPGLDVLGMIDAAAAGTLKALYVIGYDLALTLANAGPTARALAQLELVVVQDLFLNQTALAYGHVFLPAQSSLEKDGTFMNAERRVQRVRRALAPRGAARSDAEAIAALAAELGHGRHFAHAGPEAVWDEVRALWPAVAGMSYARLEVAGLQWPCRDEHDPGSAILHREAFAHGPRARLACIDPVATPEAVDADHPFLLMTGRHLQQFNAGTMTGRTAQQRLRPTDTLDIAPADASRLGLVDGSEVRVESRHGACVLPCRVDPAVRAGELYASFHDPARWLNRVTGPVRDRHTGTPAYKVTAVRLQPAVAERGPLRVSTATAAGGHPGADA